MTYAEAIEYLFSRLPMFTRIGSAAYKADLTNIRALCTELGEPHTKFKSIHIAGTNGKGSVSHMLAAVFQSAGYKTGLFTSPHLYDFRERIRINGAMIPEENVIRFVEKISQLVEKIRPSFFEITAAMAFEYFAHEKVDIAIIETGLGGRLDSTNIIQPELCVITNIGWDHMNLLGNTLESIAQEKAGIIKEGIPVILGERAADIEPVFVETARIKKSPLFFAEEEFMEISMQCQEKLDIEALRFRDNKRLSFCLDLPGLYQAKNICTTLSAIHHLSDSFNLPEAAILEGLENTKKLTGLCGRWEKIGSQPDVYLDVAHNQSGITQLIRQIGRLHFDKLHVVMGMVKDKEVEAVLSLFPKEAQYYFSNAQIPRALPASDLKTLANSIGLHGEMYDDVNDALAAARANASAEGLIVVCGSVFVVAEVKR